MNEVELNEVEKARRVIAAAERREAMFKKVTDLITTHLGLSLQERFRDEDNRAGYWVQYAILSPTGKEVADITLTLDHECNVSLSDHGKRLLEWIEEVRFELNNLNRSSC